ncbi:MAG: ABC transporter permease [Bifidobacteriaceae bacterium]|jgi:putative ABC transport system permease protein|nr:ABC transporter permease [Bifidobacteriaceae bacterium]
MLRYVLMQMRASLRQLAATGTAIVVATAFVAAALVGSEAASTTLRNIMNTRFAEADLVVYTAGGAAGDPSSLPDAVRRVAGVEAVAPVLSVAGYVGKGGRTEWVTARPLAEDQRLNGWRVTQGSEPTGLGQVSLGASVARRLGAKVGDSLRFTTEFGVMIAVAGGEDGAAGEDGDEGDDREGPEDPEDFEDPEAVEVEYTEETTDVTLSGIFDDSLPSFWTMPGMQASLATLGQIGPTGAEFWPDYSPEAVTVKAAPGADVAPGSEFRAAVGAAAAEASDLNALDAEFCPDGFGADAAGTPYQQLKRPECTLRVLDIKQAGDESVKDYLGSTAVLTAVALMFGLVGLLVAAMVIANTFQVIIAARTRTLALLRSIGATQSQVRRSVLIEGSIIGLGASAVGLGVGWLLIQGAALAAGRAYPTIPVPTSPHLPWWAAVGAVGVGAVTALLASLVPARLASRVPPVAAMRPFEPPRLSARAGKRRLAFSIVVGGLGLATLATGLVLNFITDVAQNSPNIMLLGAALGVLGGGALALGVIMGSVFWLPKVVSLVVRPLAKASGAARVAAANSVRNPRRTAATATALMIGVTLVTSMIVAAASVQRSLDRAIDTYSPVDLRVGYSVSVSGLTREQAQEFEAEEAEEPGTPPVTDQLLSQLRGVEGVQATAVVEAGLVGVADDSGEVWYYSAFGVDPQGFEATVNDSELTALLRPGVVLVNEEFGREMRVWTEVVAAWDGGPEPALPSEGLEGASRELVGASGEAVTREVDARPAEEHLLPADAVVMDADTLRELSPEASSTEVWIKLDPATDALGAVRDIQDVVTAQTEEPEGFAYQVEGRAVQRYENKRIVETMLLIGLALLAVSVVVALVGVSNTLSLSVIERARETALLRALGLTSRETRGMLALEGMVIAGVAGLMGCLIGTFFGMAGSALLLGSTGYLSLAFPAGRVGVVFALSLVTGLLASVLPGRRAAKTPPAEALASE